MSVISKRFGSRDSRVLEGVEPDLAGLDGTDLLAAIPQSWRLLGCSDDRVKVPAAGAVVMLIAAFQTMLMT